MQFKDQVDFVRQHIKKNKMRVFMTVLAATMGTAFLIVLASVGFGLHDTLRKEALEYGLVTEITVYEKEENTLPEAYVDEFRDIEHVRAVIQERTLATDAILSLDDFESSASFNISDFEEKKKIGFELEEGRLPEAPHEVVVGYHFAETLQKQVDDEAVQYDKDLVGKTIQIGMLNHAGEEVGKPLEMTIVGRSKAPTKEWVLDMSFYADATIIPEIEKNLTKEVGEDQPIFYSNIAVHADQLENVSAISSAIKDQGFYTYSVVDELEQLDVFFLALKAGLVFVGTIAILIASIGIFNTMTMAVTERTREIGVMKSLGASPKLIQRLFIMESAWIGIIGTAIAVIISYGISALSNYLLPIIVTSALGEEEIGEFNITFSHIPWQLIVIASIISIGVAIISGWRPARKATKIDVIQALRQEL